MLFTLGEIQSTNQNDLPDAFFDVTNDIHQVILQTQADGIIDQPVMMAKLREMEEKQEQLRMLNRYKAIFIRICFPKT